MCLMFHPLGRPVGHGVEPFLPHVAPAVADDGRVWRHRVVELHDRAPPEIVACQHTAIEMDVFEPAVIRAHDRCDCLEGRRTSGRHLKRVVGPPRLAEHADSAIAPVLGSDPFNDADAVVGFDVRIFIEHHTFAVAAAALVDPDGGVAGIREKRVRGLVPHAGPITTSIGNIFQNAGDGFFTSPFRQPEPCRQFHAVRHRYPDRFDHFSHVGAP